jgi:ATP-binding cassette, subfamily B, multidrug efflux pump
LKSLKYLNKYFFKYKLRLSLGIVFIALSNIAGVYPAVLVRKAIDYIALALEQQIPENVFIRQLLIFVALIIGIALLSGFFMFLMRQTIIVMSRLIEYDLKNEIYEHYQKLDHTFYKRNNTGDLMNRISEDVSRVRMYIGPAIMYLVNTLVTVATVIFFMTHVNLELTLYVLAPLPVLSIAIYYVSNVIHTRSTFVQQQLSKLSTFSQETFSGIRILKAYNREKYIQEQMVKESHDYKEKNLALVKTEALFQPFMVLMIGLSVVLTIFIGGRQAIAGQISIGNISEFVLYVYKLTWPFASLGFVTSLVQRAAASQARINEFLHTEPSISNNQPIPTKIEGKIELKNASYTYPDTGIKALDSVTFSVNKGSSLAILGKTGSGKSTIANIICRLIDADSGEVLIDGKNIKQLNLNSLRSSIGYVPQEVFLFSDSIAGNIAFSGNELLKDPKKIDNAAKAAAIWDNIQEFPAKLETVVGERGITLSGGQKQRISIARAIIKSPQILIFDDCLSAVDTETEKEILDNLNDLMDKKTTLIISHRVSSVQHADHIIVLHEGKIIEEGNHSELLQLKGSYHRLYKMQQLEEMISPQSQ